MCGSFIHLGEFKLYLLCESGPELRTGQDAVDVMSEAAEQQASWIAIPVARLGDDFFELRTRTAGEIVQKFAVYGAKVAIVGDISHRLETSQSLAAFVVEANRGEGLWFVDSCRELEDRFEALRSGAE